LVISRSNGNVRSNIEGLVSTTILKWEFSAGVRSVWREEQFKEVVDLVEEAEVLVRLFRKKFEDWAGLQKTGWLEKVFLTFTISFHRIVVDFQDFSDDVTGKIVIAVVVRVHCPEFQLCFFVNPEAIQNWLKFFAQI